MIGPAIALILRDLEGNPSLTPRAPPAVTMSYAIVHLRTSCRPLLAGGRAGSYAYNAGGSPR